MSTFLTILHVVVCLTLILIVLLQGGKGADMGAAFGVGSGQTLFGSTGASTFLGKATKIAAIIFMITSLALAYLSHNELSQSIMVDSKQSIEQKITDKDKQEVTDKKEKETESKKIHDEAQTKKTNKEPIKDKTK